MSPTGAPPFPPDPEGVRGRLLDVLGAGWDALPSDASFSELALSIFRYQYACQPVIRALSRSRGVDPDRIGDWREIPLLPATAFREFDLFPGDVARAPLVFRTSGTSSGPDLRGRHWVLDPSLYRASLLPPFRKFVLADPRPASAVLLIPPAPLLPDSSLAWMMSAVASEEAWDPLHWCVGADYRLDVSGWIRALEEVEAVGAPVLLAGTAFAFVHALDALEARGRSFRLPEGSRAMETGGFKGRSRVVPREDLYAAIARAVGIPAHRIVNEYGMTEMLSQFYESVLLEGEDPAGLAARGHRAPPWVRTRVLHPETLEPVPPGAMGLLAHVDLANLDSASAILTEDLGVELPSGGFRVIGRNPGSEPRGCSLIAEELLS